MALARTVFIVAQALTFIALAAVLVVQGEPKLGAAQGLLAAVTVLVYTA